METTPNRSTHATSTTTATGGHHNSAATSLDVDAIASHFPHTRRIIEDTATTTAAAAAIASNSPPSSSGQQQQQQMRRRSQSQQGSTSRDVSKSRGRDADDDNDGDGSEGGDNNDAPPPDASYCNPDNDDEEAAETLIDGLSPEAARRFTKLHRRRAALSRIVEERLEKAAQRREQLQAERRAHLLQIERQRQAKTQQTRMLRRAATERFVLEAPAALEVLRSAGLVCDESNGYRPLSPEAVEIILVSDPRTCDNEECRMNPTTRLRLPVCPASGQLHRRLLVVAAEKFLKLIGDTRVNLIPSKSDVMLMAKATQQQAPSKAKKSAVAAGTAAAPTTAPANANNAASLPQQSAANGPTPASQSQPQDPSTSPASASAASASTTRAKRGIAINPQLFVLAYYSAVLPDGEVDPLLRDCAVTMCHITEQIRQLLASFSRENRQRQKHQQHLEQEQQKQHAASAAEGEATSVASPFAVMTDEQEKVLKPLLIAFSREWQRYARMSNQQILSTISAEDRAKAGEELVKATAEALRHTYQRLAVAVAAAPPVLAPTSPSVAAATATTAANSSPTAAAAAGSSPTAAPPLQSLSSSSIVLLQQQLSSNSFAAAISAEIQGLSSFIAMMRSRLLRIGGQKAIDAFDKSMAEEEEAAALRGGGGGGNASNFSNNSSFSHNANNFTSIAPNHRANSAGGTARNHPNERAASASAAYDADPSASYHYPPSSDEKNTSNNKASVRADPNAAAAAPANEADEDLAGRKEIVIASPLLLGPHDTHEGTTTAAAAGGGFEASSSQQQHADGGSVSKGVGNAAPTTAPTTTAPAAPPTAATTLSAPYEYLGTSGSDTDLGGILPRRSNTANASNNAKRLVVFGPELPPLWTVGPDGKSHPPSADVLRGEKRAKLEYKVKTAYAAKMKRSNNNGMLTGNDTNGGSLDSGGGGGFTTQQELEEKFARDELTKQFDDVMWEQFRLELDDTKPPNLSRIPYLLNTVSDSLIEALPRRIRSKVGQEIRDVLDWDVLRNRLSSPSSSLPQKEAVTSSSSSSSSSASSPLSRFDSITGLVVYVINKVAQLGSPAREDDLHAKAKDLVDRLHVLMSTGSPRKNNNTAAEKDDSEHDDTIGSLIVTMFRFMLDAIRQLRLDIASFSLQMVNQDLVDNASSYEKEFVKEFMAPPPSIAATTTTTATEGEEAQQATADATATSSLAAVAVAVEMPWDSTRRFMEKGFVDSETAMLIPSPHPTTATATVGNTPTPSTFKTVLASLPPSVLYVTAANKRRFAALVSATIDLLRSSGRDNATRWVTFPKEAFYFAKPLIFEVSNAVQLLTLRLMLSGTVSMLLAPFKLNGALVQQFLAELDRKANIWLGGEGGGGQAKKDGGQKNNNDDDNADDFDEKPVNTIEDIKEAVTEHINIFLGTTPQSPAASASAPPASSHPLILSEADVTVLHSVIGKMTETSSPQYTLFESRILKAIATIALHRVGAASSGLSTDSANGATSGSTSSPSPSLTLLTGASAASATASPLAASVEIALRGCGGGGGSFASSAASVGAKARSLGLMVGNIILQNWEVYRESYQVLFPLE